MAKWTVALFGHYKPIEPGWERRAKPGDIVDFKPYEDEYIWTPEERKRFLIVTIAGPTRDQMFALREEQWDLTSYRPYMIEPDPNTLLLKMQMTLQEKIDPLSAPEKYNTILADLAVKKDIIYSDHVEKAKDRCRFPRTHSKKRRFSLDLVVLEKAGVDLKKMLDVELEYCPKLSDFDYTDCFDKMKERSIRLSDGLNLIKPRTDEEIEATVKKTNGLLQHFPI